jgi:hypothetical protein
MQRREYYTFALSLERHHHEEGDEVRIDGEDYESKVEERESNRELKTSKSLANNKE